MRNRRLFNPGDIVREWDGSTVYVATGFIGNSTGLVKLVDINGGKKKILHHHKLVLVDPPEVSHDIKVGSIVRRPGEGALHVVLGLSGRNLEYAFLEERSTGWRSTAKVVALIRTKHAA